VVLRVLERNHVAAEGYLQSFQSHSRLWAESAWPGRRSGDHTHHHFQWGATIALRDGSTGQIHLRLRWALPDGAYEQGKRL